MLGTVPKGYLDGYLLHRTCVFMALRLFFLPNFPGPTFIPCPTSIPEARVNNRLFGLFTKINVMVTENQIILNTL